MAEPKLIPNLHGPKLPIQTRLRLFDEDHGATDVVLVFWAIREELADSIGRRLRRDT